VRDHRGQIVQQRAILCDMVFQEGNLSCRTRLGYASAVSADALRSPVYEQLFVEPAAREVVLATTGADTCGKGAGGQLCSLYRRGAPLYSELSVMR
jgi:hypothetical protein